MKSLAERIDAIEKRNRRVELDKAWETSLARKVIIAILTYIVVLVFFLMAKLPNPFVNSLVPALAFLLSTLTLDFLKAIWIKKRT